MSFWPDFDALNAVRNAHTTAKTGGDALRLAADYLRRREPLPPVLADYLADAFEVAALKPVENQAEALALELGLMALNRRPVAVLPWDIAMFVDDADNGPTERQRILSAVQRFDVSETTVRRLLKLGRAEVAEEARDQAEFNLMMQDKNSDQ